jgi:serine/threonine protein kinase
VVCLDENTVVAFFASPRESGVALRVDAHAAECKACRDLLAAYAAMSPRVPGSAAADLSLLSTERDVEPPSSAANDSVGRRLAYAQAAQRVGQVLAGKWRIERVVGVGGMAQVFAAKHRNGRAVAIKLMRPELAVEPALVQRFLREAYAANRLGHAGAVPVLDDDKTEDGVPYLVMDLLEGRTLRDHLVETGPFAVDEAVRLIDQVLDVLAAAHDKGIVHRDIKPENLFETARGVRVLDFGIARLMEPMGGEGMTRSGVTMGTVGYMPPEQARGQATQIDARSDVWAVGATLYTLLTGRTVHEAPTHNEALLLAMTAPVPPVRSTAPFIPAAVAQVLDKALAFDRGTRWGDARGMQQALRAALDAKELPEPAPHAAAPRGALWVGGGVALAALGSLLLLATAHRGGPAPHTPFPQREAPQADSPPTTSPTAAPPGAAREPSRVDISSAKGASTTAAEAPPPVAPSLRTGAAILARTSGSRAHTAPTTSVTTPPTAPASPPSSATPPPAMDPLRPRI